MGAPRIRCPECRTPFLNTNINQLRLVPCSGCSGSLQVEVFPSYFRPRPAGPAAEALLDEGESTCFYHAGKKAILPCHACGRFLCALCDCELNGEHFCPACLEAGRTKGKIRSLEGHRVRYDNIALVLATVPIILVYFTLVTAPMALFIAVRNRNAPPSMIHRTRLRNAVAITLSILQILGWIILILFVAGFLVLAGDYE